MAESQIPLHCDKYVNGLKKEFVNECAEIFSKGGQKAVIDESVTIAQQKVEELLTFLKDLKSLNYRQRLSILYEFESTLNEAVRQLKCGAEGWKYLASMLGCGAAIALCGWGASALITDTLFIITSSYVVCAILTPPVITAIAIGGIGAILGLGVYFAYRWIFKKNLIAKFRSKVKLFVEDAKSKLDDCISETQSSKRDDDDEDEGFIAEEFISQTQIGLNLYYDKIEMQRKTTT